MCGDFHTIYYTKQRALAASFLTLFSRMKSFIHVSERLVLKYRIVLKFTAGLLMFPLKRGFSMRIQKSALFVLSLALFFALGLLPIQSIVAGSITPTLAYAAEAEAPTEEDSAFEDAVSEEEIAAQFDGTEGYDPSVEAMPEYTDDIGEGITGIEAISEEFDDLEYADDEAAEDELDDSVELGIIPLAIVGGGLILAGVAAYFIATKKPKQPTVQ